MTMITLTPRFAEAFQMALDWHGKQRRKGSGAPYIAHVMGVCAIVLEAGGSQNEAIAALLHDAIEDGEPEVVRPAIADRFGQAVLDIVEGCTDSDTQPKPPWRERKEKYIAQITRSSPSVRLVASADKLYNVRTIVMDYRAVGEALWPRFTGGREGTLWYYRAIADAFSAADTTPITDELQRIVAELEALVKG